MATDAVLVFGSTLAGAIAGGAASALGSAAVARRQARAEARVILYRDLLVAFSTRVIPSLAEAARAEQRSEQVGDCERQAAILALDQLVRSAVLAGKRERVLAEAVAAAFDECLIPDTDRLITVPRLREAERALNEHLRRRLS